MYPYLAYLPAYLQDFKELQALGSATDIQTKESMKYTVQQYFNQFILQADNKVVSRWEKIANLSYNPSYSLEFRRQRILIKLNSKLPITKKRLPEMLELLADITCTLGFQYEEYRMFVNLFPKGEDSAVTREQFRLILSEVHRLKPANIRLTIQMETTLEQNLFLGHALTIYKEENLLDENNLQQNCYFGHAFTTYREEELPDENTLEQHFWLGCSLTYYKEETI